jgi:hypothetical protein
MADENLIDTKRKWRSADDAAGRATAHDFVCSWLDAIAVVGSVQKL